MGQPVGLKALIKLPSFSTGLPYVSPISPTTESSLNHGRVVEKENDHHCQFSLTLVFLIFLPIGRPEENL